MWVTISDAFLRLHQFRATSFQIPNHPNILNNKKNGGAFSIHFLFNLLLNGIPKNPSAIAAASFLGGLGSSPQKLSDINYGGQYWALLNVDLSLGQFFLVKIIVQHGTTIVTLLNYSDFWNSPTVHLLCFATCTYKTGRRNLHLIFVLQLDWKRCLISSWVGSTVVNQNCSLNKACHRIPPSNKSRN